MLIIDRFEGGLAVVETDSGMMHIPLSDLPKGAKEGDVLRISIDEEETSGRKERISHLMKKLL